MKKEDIKSFEDACKVKGIDPVTSLPDVANIPEEHRQAVIDNLKMIIIAEALNDGWKPNWADHREWKYWPWFHAIQDSTRPSGFRLSYGGYVSGGSLTRVGSRLCFKDEETAEYAGTQFFGLYESFFLK